MAINRNIESLTVRDEQAVDLSIHHDGGITQVTIYPEDGRWYEGEIMGGPSLYGWGGKTYRGDFANIIDWLESDYGDVEILDTYMWYG